MTTITFAFIGASIGIIYLRTKRRTRIIASLVAGISFLFLYFTIMSFSEFSYRVISTIIWIFGSDISPFKWLSAPVLYELYPSSLTILEGICGFIFLITITIASFQMIFNRFIEGKIQPPVEIIKFYFKPSIIDKLFKSPIRGLLKKEFRISLREPSLIWATIGFIILIVGITASMGLSTRTSGAGNASFFGVLYVLVTLYLIIPTSYFSASLAIERHSIMNVFMSPVSGWDILKPKVIVMLIYMLIGLVAEIIVIEILLNPDIQSLLLIMISFLETITLSLGLGIYLAAHYTDFKAKNPRKALKTTGSLILMGTYMLYNFVSIIVSIIIHIFLGFLAVITCHVVILSVILIVSRTFAKAASRRIEQIEATEYL